MICGCPSYSPPPSCAIKRCHKIGQLAAQMQKMDICRITRERGGSGRGVGMEGGFPVVDRWLTQNPPPTFPCSLFRVLRELLFLWCSFCRAEYVNYFARSTRIGRGARGSWWVGSVRLISELVGMWGRRGALRAWSAMILLFAHELYQWTLKIPA